MIIYLVGPYRAITEYEVLQNIREAEDMAALLWEEGYAVICPHKNSAHFSGIIPEEELIERYCEVVKRCDAVFTLPDWQQSEGSRREVEAAKEGGVIVFDKVYHLNVWRERKDEIENDKHTTN